jgi:hypothetical protein
MNCSTNRNFTAALGALAFFIIASGGCTEVDDRLGSGLIPKNQRMEIEVTSPENGVQTFLYRLPGIPSSRTGYGYFGSTVDADGVFGSQTSSLLVQFLPVSLPYSEEEGYGIDPIVDSAVLVMTLSQTRGDTTAVQRFDVWDVVPGSQPALSRDSTYYTDFPIEQYKGEKLFEFTHTGKRSVSARLFPTAAGKEYLNRIVSIKGDDWDTYTVDSLFLERFQGLYITPAEGSPADATLYGFDLAESGFELYVRNHDTLDVSAIYDTLTTLFMFRDTDAAATTTTNAVEWPNVSVNMTTMDYTGSVLGALEVQTNGFTDTLPTSTPLSRLYVQSMNGVGTYLRFTDPLIEEIRNLRFKIDPETGEKVGKNIAINQAMMRIWIENDTVEGLDASMPRIGSYLDPKKLLPIPDYQYAQETYQNQYSISQGGDGYSLPYGGYLNRSTGYYELDITSYVQQLARVKEGDAAFRYIAPAFFLAPEAYELIGTGESILKGFGSDKPVSIRITYTIIEG